MKNNFLNFRIGRVIPLLLLMLALTASVFYAPDRIKIDIAAKAQTFNDVIRSQVFTLVDRTGATAVTTPSSGERTVFSTSAGVFVKNSSDVSKKFFVSGTATLASAATITLDSTLADTFLLTPGQDLTINATTVGLAGQKVDLIITTTGTTSRTITFGTNLKNTGTLATGTVDAKKFVIAFVSDGTTYVERYRTTAQ